MRAQINLMVKHQLSLVIIAGIAAAVQGRMRTDNIGLIWATLGLFVIAFAVISTIGAWGATRNFTYQYGLTMEKSIIENWEDSNKEMQIAFQFLTSSFGIGIVAILGGLLLMIIGG
ncbi:MAG: hypothetical protein L0154_26010 [Chloroflexi bacterium]|nr:hypothetical protein [Chloroflexota bacterium]